MRFWGPLGMGVMMGATILTMDDPAWGNGVTPPSETPRSASAIRTLKRGPYLFLDDTLIARSEKVIRRVNSPRKHPANPIITGREDRCFQPYVTVVKDRQTGRFRMWYGMPESASQSHLATIESKDGLHWIRPHRQLPDPAPIQFGVSILDEEGRVANPAERFKFAWWHDGGLRIASSPNGLDWKPISDRVVLPHNHDINNLFWDPIRKHYVATVSSYTTGEGWKGQRRVSMQAFSNDLKTWTRPFYVITPDERDEGETQFYCMGGLLARGDLLIGMVRVLRDDLPADSGGPVRGLGYTTLAWSHDGIHWTRDREPFLNRDLTSGAWDHAMTWVDCQLPVGDSVYFYYGGYARGHKVERFTERQIGVAILPRDRYVAREAGAAPGHLVTPPVRIDGARIAVNVEAMGGAVRAQLLTPEGKPIPGFRFADGVAVKGDHLAAPLHWKRPLTALKGAPVCIEFEMTQARLYAFEVQ